ncbi:hypothetical protein K1719_000760 [Acacia pycnantha]|nr:hypothetical protein K1719_000760 [Acacia pycnantha]
MSHGGYEKAEKELMAAKRKRWEEEAQSNPSVICDMPSPIRCEDLWLGELEEQGRPKKYFGLSKHNKQAMVTCEEMEHIVATVREQVEARDATLRVIFEAQIIQMKEEVVMIVSSHTETSVPVAHSLASIQQSTKGSCYIVGQP